MADRFAVCLPHVLREEVDWREPFVWTNIHDNFSNEAGDPGGETMCGITQREYSHYRKSHKETVRDVRFCTEKEGEWIYKNWYWLPHCDLLPSGADLSFFDSSVNEGSFEAIRLLQRAIHVQDDGIWGPNTEAAIKRVSPRQIITEFATRRRAAYHSTWNFQRFGRDWIARTDRIEKASFDMVV